MYSASLKKEGMKKIKDHNHNISRNIIHENVSLLIITPITISNPTTNI